MDGGVDGVMKLGTEGNTAQFLIFHGIMRSILHCGELLSGYGIRLQASVETCLAILNILHDDGIVDALQIGLNLFSKSGSSSESSFSSCCR